MSIKSKKKFSSDIDENFSLMAKFARYVYQFSGDEADRMYIPDTFRIDRQLTTDNDNVIMVDDTSKIAIWSIRGTVGTFNDYLHDFKILVSNRYTAFDDSYYKNKLNLIIQKYKLDNNYKIFLSSHSLGANKQLSLFIDADSSYNIDYIDGIFNFAIGTGYDDTNSLNSICLPPNQPFLCEKLKAKNFIIFMTNDLVSNSFKESRIAIYNDIAQFYNIDLPPYMVQDTYIILANMQEEFEVKGKLWDVPKFLYDQAKLLFSDALQSHSVDYFINEYRRLFNDGETIELTQNKMEVTDLINQRQPNDNSYNIPPIYDFNIFNQPSQYNQMAIYKQPSTPVRFDFDMLNPPNQMAIYKQPTTPVRLILTNNNIGNQVMNFFNVNPSYDLYGNMGRTAFRPIATATPPPSPINPRQTTITAKKRVQRANIGVVPQGYGASQAESQKAYKGGQLYINKVVPKIAPNFLDNIKPKSKITLLETKSI